MKFDMENVKGGHIGCYDCEWKYIHTKKYKIHLHFSTFQMKRLTTWKYNNVRYVHIGPLCIKLERLNE